LVERRVPGALEPLRGGERAAQRRAHILAEDVGDAVPLLRHVQGHADGLDPVAHSSPRPRALVAKTWAENGAGSGCGSWITRRCASWSSCVNCARSRSHSSAVIRPRCCRRASNPLRQSASSTTRFAPEADEWPCRRETIASSRNGLRSVRTY